MASTRLRVLAIFVAGVFVGLVLAIDDLLLALEDHYRPGDEVTLTLVRGGQTVTLPAILGGQ